MKSLPKITVVTNRCPPDFDYRKYKYYINKSDRSWNWYVPIEIQDWFIANDIPCYIDGGVISADIVFGSEEDLSYFLLSWLDSEFLIPGGDRISHILAKMKKGK